MSFERQILFCVSRGVVFLNQKKSGQMAPVMNDLLEPAVEVDERLTQKKIEKKKRKGKKKGERESQYCFCGILCHNTRSIYCSVQLQHCR